MEEILDKMGSTLITPENKSEFEGLYKNWGKLNNQEERRKELLENQKNHRQSQFDKLRGILELVSAVEDDDLFQRKQKKVNYRPSIYVAGFHRASLSYKNILMFSEWMIERPEDFNENWLVSPCPKGTRMLVVATRGSTKFFNKYGHFKFCVNTYLPGGSAKNNKRMGCCSVLDGFYHVKTNTLYVIDFLAWNNQPMTDCETEFRNYWLESQFAERPELGELSDDNQVRLILLPKVQCTTENLNRFMMTFPPFKGGVPELDGLLFYHKRAHYTPGMTPLVGWLFPYMVQEVIGSDITVHDDFMADKPIDYYDQQSFIKMFDAKLAKKQRRGRHQPMDTAQCTEPPKEEGEETIEDQVEDKIEVQIQDQPDEVVEEIVVDQITDQQPESSSLEGH